MTRQTRQSTRGLGHGMRSSHTAAAVPYLAQTTLGGCGACSFIMVAKTYVPSLMMTELEALERFGVDHGARCFALAISFHRAAESVDLSVRVSAMDREQLRAAVAVGPVILYHKASEAADAVPHFSVAIDATEREIIRHDPGVGAAIVDPWEKFETVWDAAKVSWWPYDGCYAAVLRPKPTAA
jgi:hypothetical protein